MNIQRCKLTGNGSLCLKTVKTLVVSLYYNFLFTSDKALNDFVHRVKILSNMLINSLPNDIFLGWPKLKSFADDKINANEKLKFVLGRVENIV